MHPCKTALGGEVEKGLLVFFLLLLKLLTTLKIYLYFKMITPCPVSILGQVEFQETLSCIKENKLSNLKILAF